MINRISDKEEQTLNFSKPDAPAIQETFYPWDLSVARWRNEGLGKDFLPTLYRYDWANITHDMFYLNALMADDMLQYDKYFGLDPILRLQIMLPFTFMDAEVLEQTSEFRTVKEPDGSIRKYYQDGKTEELKNPVESEQDWEVIKKHAESELIKYFTIENVKKNFEKYVTGAQEGEFTVRLNCTGFFWTPRTLFGIENHLYAFYDYPEIMHEINKFTLSVYQKILPMITKLLPVNLLYINEDLSGVNGPMLSPVLFDEFVAPYTKKTVELAKSCGIANVFVDTDGDFMSVIPNYIACGVDGFLPMDVNAGMDIVKVREQYPKLKFIGGFNKLCIEKGKEAIDAEFERILPVVKQGGYIVGNDHQVPPSASLENYRYYLERLKAVMQYAGIDAENNTNK